MPRRATLCALTLALAGCGGTVQRASEALDGVEAEVRAARVSYQDRLDRISLEWMCDGMAYPDLVRAFGDTGAAARWWNQMCPGGHLETPEAEVP